MSNQPNPAPFQWGCLALLIVCGGGFALSNYTLQMRPQGYTSPAASSSAPASRVVAFNVPALVGLDVEGVKRQLGPTSSQTPPPGVSSWGLKYVRNGQTLRVHYNPQTGRVLDFFLPTTDPSGASPDLGPLLVAGALATSAGNYVVEGVPASGMPGKFTGVKVTPR